LTLTIITVCGLALLVIVFFYLRRYLQARAERQLKKKIKDEKKLKEFVNRYGSDSESDVEEGFRPKKRLRILEELKEIKVEQAKKSKSPTAIKAMKKRLRRKLREKYARRMLNRKPGQMPRLP